MMLLVLSSAPCLELFSAAPEDRDGVEVRGGLLLLGLGRVALLGERGRVALVGVRGGLLLLGREKGCSCWG